MNDTSPDAFKNYVRRSLYVFAAVLLGTGLMVGLSFAPLHSQSLRIGLILAAAAVNAVLVGGYLMHLFSEKKMIYTLLVFTAIFFAGLMTLTLVAHGDVPAVISH